MTTAFVAGATGYTGREVVRLLRERGIGTIAHVRPDSSRLPEWRARFTEVGATPDTTAWEPGAMADSMQRLRPDLVFALLGTTRSRARAARHHDGADAGYEAIDYGLTMLLYAAVRAAALPARFVYLSSAGVGSQRGSGYLAVRARVERALRDGPVPYTIARPSFITGADRDEFRPGERLGAAFVDRVLAMAGWFGARSLRERYRSTTGTELARALVGLALDPAGAGRTVESAQLRGY